MLFQQLSFHERIVCGQADVHEHDNILTSRRFVVNLACLQFQPFPLAFIKHISIFLFFVFFFTEKLHVHVCCLAVLFFPPKKQIGVTQSRAGKDSVCLQKCSLQGTCFCAALWSRGHRWLGYSGRSAVPVALQITSERACQRGAWRILFFLWRKRFDLHAYIPINLLTPRTGLVSFSPRVSTALASCTQFVINR